MKRFLSLLLVLVAAAFARADTPDPLHTIPSAGASFLEDLRTFLKEEDAERFDEQFTSFVVSGGTHATGAGLTHAPGALVAYPGGFRTTENGSITYQNNSTCWVIAHKDTSGNIGTFTRVAGTHYLTDCASGSEPALPADSVFLMRVTTSGGSVTKAVSKRRLSAVLESTVFNVKDFGAVGDGATDDIAAIQETLEVLVATGGGILDFPRSANPYMISAPIRLDPAIDPSAHVIFRGHGHLASIIKPLAGFAGTALILIGDTAEATLLSHFQIRDLHLTCRDSASAQLVISGIKVHRSAQWEIQNNTIGVCQIAIEIVGISSVGLIAHNIIGSNNVHGIKLDNVSTIRVIGNDIQEGRAGGGGIALDCARCGPRMLIANNRINDWEGVGINVGAFGSNTQGFGTIVGNDIEDTAGVLLAEERGTFTGNRIYNSATGDIVRLTAADWTFTGNTVDGGGGQGVFLTVGSHTISGNRIRNTGNHGIRLSSVSNVSVSGNTVTGAGSDGIAETGTSNDNTIVGNKVGSSVGSNYTFVGASTSRIPEIRTGVASIDFGATGNNDCDVAVTTINVPGVTQGDAVFLGVPDALAASGETVIFGWVATADTVKVKRCNVASGAAPDPPAAAVRAVVVQQ